MIKKEDIQNLNLDELDVEALERRLELAILGPSNDPDAAEGGCGVNYGCVEKTPTQQ